MHCSESLKDLETRVLKIKQELKTLDVARDDVTDISMDLSNIGVLIPSIERGLSVDDEYSMEQLARIKGVYTKLVDFVHGVEKGARDSFLEINYDEKKPHESGDGQFFKKKNEKLDSFISDAFENLENLTKQRRIIEKTRNTVLRGKERMGVGIETIRGIADRYVNDYFLFVIGVVFIVCLIIFVKMFV